MKNLYKETLKFTNYWNEKIITENKNGDTNYFNDNIVAIRTILTST